VNKYNSAMPLHVLSLLSLPLSYAFRSQLIPNKTRTFGKLDGKGWRVGMWLKEGRQMKWDEQVSLLP
jgi:hypothetical protein